MQKPLTGIRVLDLTRVLAGPYATMVLADLGAEVIKVEIPGIGDDSRSFGPFVGKESAYFMSINRNKKGMVLNLKVTRAKEILKQLAARSDVLVENFRPGTLDRLGLGYEVLEKVNPRLIYAACSGYGRTGPYRDKPAYDIIVQAMGGIMSITGQPDGPPTRVGASIGDITAGLFTTIGILAALHERERSGLGQLIDVAMLDCQLAILENAISRYLVSGEIPGRLGNRHPTITPFTSFPTKSGHLIVGAGNDGIFIKLCEAIGMPDLAQDPRFKTNPLRTEHWEELKPILEAVFAEKTTDEWISELEKHGIPCGPINTIDKVVSNPQVLARNMLVELNHPIAGRHTLTAAPIKFSRTPASVDTPAPTLGQHTEEILKGILGYTDDEIAQCAREGCFSI